MTERDFDLGDVLSVTTGMLVSPRHMEGIYDILNFATGDDLFTHQLPRAIREVRPVILAWHPDLAAVDASTVTPENHKEWLVEQKRRFGETRRIERLNEDQHERIDPLSELVEKVSPDRIVVVRP
jgi:hypothetical protein